MQYDLQSIALEPLPTFLARGLMRARDSLGAVQNRPVMPDIDFHWNDPPENWRSNGADIHVWAAALDIPPGQISSYESTLCLSERERAERYHFERDRNRFIVGRGVLRAVLGSYLGVEPAQLSFDYGARGKPVLTDLPDRRTLHFNVSHSDGLALVAVTSVCAVGIDVERIRSMDDAEELAVRFFSPREVAELKALPRDRHALAFFNLWTRKEACLKATGEGITELLGQIEVSFVPGEPARVVSIGGIPQAAAGWTVDELNPASQFKAAIAAAAGGLRISCWHWPD
jgi:4'-phosphopantetheinyl transferase